MVEYTLTFAVDVIAALVLGAFSSRWLHEAGHYMTGLVGRSKPTLSWQIPYLLPDGVFHQNIDQADDWVIRVSGLTVFLWLILLAPATIVLWPIDDFSSLIAVLTLAGAFGISTRSDWTAFTDPDEFRRRHRDGTLRRDRMLTPWQWD